MQERMKRINGRKLAAAIIWLMGCGMTAAAIDQMTQWPAMTVLAAAAAFQLVLTFAQSPVWAGRGGVISYTALAVDTVINFGGTLAILANVDAVGSVQALSATFGGPTGAWPMWFKGLLALGASALVAGLPEFLWKEA